MAGGRREFVSDSPLPTVISDTLLTGMPPPSKEPANAPAATEGGEKKTARITEAELEDETPPKEEKSRVDREVAQITLLGDFTVLIKRAVFNSSIKVFMIYNLRAYFPPKQL